MKMRTLILFCFVALMACNNTQNPSETNETETTVQEEQLTPATDPAVQEGEPAEEQPATTSALLGSYVGDFEAKEVDPDQNYSYVNRINIQVQSLEDGRISGRSIVAGNDRPFTGTYTVDSKGQYQVVAEEPGDDRYDGTFEFTITSKGSTIFGTWTANDQGLAVPVREYQLDRKIFEYSPQLELPESVGWAQLYNGEHPEEFQDEFERLSDNVRSVNPSTTRLTAADVENLYQGDLEVMRNSIYARHGYSFRNRRMRYIFDRYVDWYIPVSTDIRDELTEIELANIELIKRYEEHADKYYDVFGR